MRFKYKRSGEIQKNGLVIWGRFKWGFRTVVKILVQSIYVDKEKVLWFWRISMERKKSTCLIKNDILMTEVTSSVTTLFVSGLLFLGYRSFECQVNVYVYIGFCLTLLEVLYTITSCILL